MNNPFEISLMRFPHTKPSDWKPGNPTGILTFYGFSKDVDKDIEPDDEEKYPDWHEYKENYMPYLEGYEDPMTTQYD